MSWQPPASQYGAAPQAGLRPLAVGDILDVTFRLYRQNFVPMIKIALLGVVPAQLLSLLLLVSAVPDFETTDEFGRTTADGGDFFRFFAGILSSTVVAGIASLVVTAAITKAVAHSYVDNAPIDFKASLGEAFRRILPLIGMTIVYFLGVAIGMIPCGVGFFWLSVSWSVAAPVLMMERAGVFKSLGRSFALVRPRFWPTAGLLILVYLMRQIATQIISTPITMIFGAGSGFFSFDSNVAASDFNETYTKLLVASAVAGIIAGVLITPFHAIVKVVLYVDLRVRNEGFDIQVLARSLGVDAPPPPHTVPPPPPIARPMVPPDAPEPPRWGSPPAP